MREGNSFIWISAERAEGLKVGWKKSMLVLIQIDGRPEPAWRISMMPVGDGRFYLYLHGDVRKASGTKVGDEVLVEIAFDEEYKNGPMHEMPEWFEEALQKNPMALTNWTALSPSRQKEILRYFSWLKSDEAKQRNVERAIDVLSGKEGRFMARNWKDGR